MSRWLTAADFGVSVCAEFRDADEALAGLEVASADFRRHGRAPRGIAGDYFEASVVLTRPLTDIGG